MEGYIPVGTGPKGTVEGAALLGGSPDGIAGGAWITPRAGAWPALRRMASFCVGHSRRFGRGLFR